MAKVLVLLVTLLVGTMGGRAEQSPAPAAPRVWTMDDMLPALSDLGKGRDWMQGGRVFQDAGCGICHALGTYWEGNGLAPDLTAVASKLTRDIILQSILEPSAALNGQYYHTEFELKDGTIIRGSVVADSGGTFKVAPVMMAPDVTVDVPKANVKAERPSPVSPMPAGLLNSFTREQVLDLLAFLEAGGNQDAAIYRK